MEKPKTASPRACAAAYFLELERALERGQLRRAAQMQKRLKKLGYEVVTRPSLIRDKAEGHR